MFTVSPSGFCVALPNGYDVSVAFGLGNYCSNREGVKRNAMRLVECPNAEMCVFKTGTNEAVQLPKGDFDWSLGSDGYLLLWASPDHFAKLIAWVESLPDWRAAQFGELP